MNASDLYEAYVAAAGPNRGNTPAFNRLSVAAQKRWEAVGATARRLVHKELGLNPSAADAELLAIEADAAEKAAELALTKAEEARDAADKAAEAKAVEERTIAEAKAEAKRKAEEEAKAKAGAASKAKTTKATKAKGGEKPKETDK